jgi:hypothetical protein
MFARMDYGINFADEAIENSSNQPKHAEFTAFDLDN